MGGGIRMGNYFLFDTPLTTIRKRERGDALPENMPFIKADKTNRASFPVAMVLKASLITLFGVVLFGLYWAVCMGYQLIFLNLSALLYPVESVSWIWDILLLFVLFVLTSIHQKGGCSSWPWVLAEGKHQRAWSYPCSPVKLGSGSCRTFYLSSMLLIPLFSLRLANWFLS